jgi:hypothetical protein
MMDTVYGNASCLVHAGQIKERRVIDGAYPPHEFYFHLQAGALIMDTKQILILLSGFLAGSPANHSRRRRDKSEELHIAGSQDSRQM